MILADRDAASSFVSYRSRGGSGFDSVAIAAATSSLPQPEYASRPVAQAAHPVSAFASAAVRSRIEPTCSAVRSGRRLKRIAAAALTCGAENDVPCAWRYSSGPQLEKPWSAHAGKREVSGRGKVERICSPGAARSL